MLGDTSRKYVVWVNNGADGWSPVFSSDDLAEVDNYINKTAHYGVFLVTKRLDVKVEDK